MFRARCLYGEPCFCYFVRVKVVTKSAEETKDAARAWLNPKFAGSGSGKATVVALIGNLGAGKTTFTQAVAEALGVKENITSPTFVIEKIYKLKGQKWQNLIHLDCYRLDKPEELLHLGWAEIASEPENLILVEWADKFPELFTHAEKIYFNHGEGDHREINFT